MQTRTRRHKMKMRQKIYLNKAGMLVRVDNHFKFGKPSLM